MAGINARSGAITALAFLGTSAIIGALPMIWNPSNSPLGMPLSLLRHSPFHSFLIPGLVLLLANGVLSLIALSRVLVKRRNCEWWAMGQGAVLAGWLVIECIMLRAVAWPHWLYGAVAALLIITGWAMKNSHSRQIAIADTP